MAFCQVITLYKILGIVFCFESMTVPYQNIYLLYKKLLQYKHHRINYSECLLRGITPFGLCIKQQAQITPVSIDFCERWDVIVKNVPSVEL